MTLLPPLLIKILHHLHTPSTWNNNVTHHYLANFFLVTAYSATKAILEQSNNANKPQLDIDEKLRFLRRESQMNGTWVTRSIRGSNLTN